MPELPEVETTVKGLKTILAKIFNVKIHTTKLRLKFLVILKKHVMMLKYLILENCKIYYYRFR